MKIIGLLKGIFNTDKEERKQIILIVVSIVITIQFYDLFNTYWKGVEQQGAGGFINAIFLWIATFMAVLFAIFVFMFIRGIFRVFKLVE